MLDPDLEGGTDALQSIWRWSSLASGGGWLSATSKVRKRTVHIVNWTYGTNFGMMLVRRNVRQWKREKVANGRMVTDGHVS